MGLNAESLASKIDHIRIFLSLLKEKGIIFDAICINECWLETFDDDLNIDGYNAFPLLRKVGAKGGLVTYILNDYTTIDLEMYQGSQAWEGQFLELKGNGLRAKTMVGNIYVPPRGRGNFTDFKTNFLPIINSLSVKFNQILISVTQMLTH